MTIENNDRLLVNRADKSYQIKYEKIKTDITEDIDAFPEAPEDGVQYARQDATWTEIIHTEAYTDADVDAHLNTNQAEGGQILSYTDGDYKWVNDQTGGSDFTNYTHPGGISRSVQSRLEDYTSVKDFGAKGDGSTDDTLKIQAAIDWVGENGGGTVYFPPGIYMVELKGQKSSGSSNWHNCALSVNFDNVHLVGAGQVATRIKAIATEFEVLNYGEGDEDGDGVIDKWEDTSYGLIEVIKYPFGNAGDGGTPVQGGSIRDISFDNNISSNEVMSGGVVHLKHTYNYTIENVTIQNSPFYGLAMQNGGFRNVTLNNLRLAEINRDGIDLKDNGNMSESIQLSNIYCKRCCRGDRANRHSRFAAIDIQGMGIELNNISVVDMGTDDQGAAIRLKQAGQGGARGNSGRLASINNVYINTGKRIAHGIQVKAGCVSISNAKIITPEAEIGVQFIQNHCSLTNSYIEGCDIGLDLNKRSKTGFSENDPDDLAVLDAEFPDGLGADFAMIQSNTFAFCTTGVQIRRPKCNVSNNTFREGDFGINANDAIVDSAVITGNIFDSSVGNDIARYTGTDLYLFNNIGHWGPAINTRNTTSNGPWMSFEAADGDINLKLGRGIGFFGANPVQKQTVTGDIRNNTDDVLRDLIRELAQYGLIRNDTTN